VTSTSLSYDHYSADGHEEWLMGIGSPNAPPILFVPPLFEELNRTRALIAAIMRGVASQGFGCWLLDLPGSGESERLLERLSWDQWRSAVRTAAVQISHGNPLAGVVGIRGGSLLDDVAPARCAWRFAPVAGASLVRDLNRAGLAAGGGMAGYELAPNMIGPLDMAEPHPKDSLRIVRLESDRGEAHMKIEGPALWRRSEPESSVALSAALSDDIANWVGRCADS
jgi:pimeloyl-ACP methyl ester carboxylesterase